jgi:hypothetical protein
MAPVELNATTPACPAEALFRLSASIRAVQGGEMNPFSRALVVLERVSATVAAPLAIVGGLAAIHHQAGVTTLDVDIVVPREWQEAILAECQRQGLTLVRHSPQGWHRLLYQDADGEVAIEFLPEGGRPPRDPAHAPPIPSPGELGVASGLGYASFAGWVAMKLVAGRDKDRYHLTEAFKRAGPQQLAEAVVAVRKMDPSYLKELEKLVRAAEDEDQRDW